MRRYNSVVVAVQAFEALYGKDELSKLPPDQPVDTSQNALYPLVGKTWKELTALKSDPENKSRPEIRALKRLGKFIDLIHHLTLPDLLNPLHGMTGDEIRKIRIPSKKSNRNRNPGSSLFIAIIAIVAVAAAAAALYPRGCPKCQECAKCQECSPCPVQPTCPPCIKSPPCRSKPAETNHTFTSGNVSFDACIRILMAREKGDASKALLIDVKKSSKQQIKKAVLAIIKDIHPDKVSPGLRVVCTEASSYISQFL
jgi:hypothetical protein